MAARNEEARARVLVVDDAEGIRSYLANLLELKGYDVDTAEDGRRALALLEGGADPEFFGSSGPLRGYKRSLHDGGIRVPTIAWWPDTLKPGQTSDQIWAFWDFLPTALELAGGEVPDGIDGISIVPTLNALGRGGDTDQPQQDYWYWEFHERRFAQAVRTGDWKAVRSGDSWQLFNLAEDLGETTDLAEAHPELLAELVTASRSNRRR